MCVLWGCVGYRNMHSAFCVFPVPYPGVFFLKPTYYLPAVHPQSNLYILFYSLSILLCLVKGGGSGEAGL